MRYKLYLERNEIVHLNIWAFPFFNKLLTQRSTLFILHKMIPRKV